MAAINYAKLHEQEHVFVLLPSPIPPSVIGALLKEAGGILHDDFVDFPRTDRVEPWQSGSISTVTLFTGDSDLEYHFDDPDADDSRSCDRLRLSHLMATVSAEAVERFLDLVAALEERTRGVIEHQGRQLSVDELRDRFSAYREDIAEELAEEPGSEFLAITIAESYPRPAAHNKPAMDKPDPAAS